MDFIVAIITVERSGSTTRIVEYDIQQGDVVLCHSALTVNGDMEDAAVLDEFARVATREAELVIKAARGAAEQPLKGATIVLEAGERGVLHVKSAPSIGPIKVPDPKNPLEEVTA